VPESVTLIIHIDGIFIFGDSNESVRTIILFNVTLQTLWNWTVCQLREEEGGELSRKVLTKHQNIFRFWDTFRIVFWDVLPCKIIIPDDGGCTYLWNVGRQLFYTAVYPRKQFWTSYLPPWELEISPWDKLSVLKFISLKITCSKLNCGWFRTAKPYVTERVAAVTELRERPSLL
jgi:hypothetical protein